MAAAPEMSPTLSEALNALDPYRREERLTPEAFLAWRFLKQLEELSPAPGSVHAVPFDSHLAFSEHMEGAYQAGVRCVDESGQVLAMSLPVFVALTARRPSPKHTRFRRWLASLVADCPPGCEDCQSHTKVKDSK